MLYFLFNCFSWENFYEWNYIAGLQYKDTGLSKWVQYYNIHVHFACSVSKYIFKIYLKDYFEKWNDSNSYAVDYTVLNSGW